MARVLTADTLTSRDITHLMLQASVDCDVVHHCSKAMAGNPESKKICAEKLNEMKETQND